MNKQEDYIFDHDFLSMAVAIQLDNVNTATDHLIRLERLIARRFDHEQPVMLGDRISVAQGGFAETGGNQHAPMIAPLPGTILVVHNIDKEVAELSIEREPHIFSPVEENFAKILALRDERQRLKRRIQSLNDELLEKYIVQDAINEEEEEYARLVKSGGVPFKGVEGLLEFPDEVDVKSCERPETTTVNGWF